MKSFSKQYQKFLLPLLGAVVSSSLVTIVWFAVQDFGKPVVHVDMPLYNSIEELKPVSDLVVHATVGPVKDRETDYGTSDPAQKNGAGIPIVFYEVTVIETLHGSFSGTTITVGVPDNGSLNLSEYAVTLQRAQELLLFLNEETSVTAPGITVSGPLYSTVSLSNGIFEREAEASRFVPRLPLLFNQDDYSLEEAKRQMSPP